MFAPPQFYETVKKRKASIDDLLYYLKRVTAVLASNDDCRSEVIGLEKAQENIEEALHYINGFTAVFKEVEGLALGTSTLETMTKAVRDRANNRNGELDEPVKEGFIRVLGTNGLMTEYNVDMLEEDLATLKECKRTGDGYYPGGTETRIKILEEAHARLTGGVVTIDKPESME